MLIFENYKAICIMISEQWKAGLVENLSKLITHQWNVRIL